MPRAALQKARGRSLYFGQVKSAAQALGRATRLLARSTNEMPPHTIIPRFTREVNDRTIVLTITNTPKHQVDQQYGSATMTLELLR